MNRRGFLTAAGIGVASAAVGGSYEAAESAPSLGPTARVAHIQKSGGAGEVRTVFRTNPTGRLIALTFDDGPDATWTSRMLAMLAKHDARATFFLVGQHLIRRPDLARMAAAAGHELGNHTWAHSDLTRNNRAFVSSSLQRTHELIAQLTGHDVTLFRPPWGRIDSVGLGVCTDMRYDVVLWSHHITGSNPFGDAAVAEGAAPGSIILAHDGGSEPNARLMLALDGMIGDLKQRGFEFVTVGKLLAASERPPADAMMNG